MLPVRREPGRPLRFSHEVGVLGFGDLDDHSAHLPFDATGKSVDVLLPIRRVPAHAAVDGRPTNDLTPGCVNGYAGGQGLVVLHGVAVLRIAQILNPVMALVAPFWSDFTLMYRTASVFAAGRLVKATTWVVLLFGMTQVSVGVVS